MLSNKLEGLSFCVMGNLSHFKNKYQEEELVLKHGGVFRRGKTFFS